MISPDLAIAGGGAILSIVGSIFVVGVRHGRHKRKTEQNTEDIADHEERLRTLQTHSTETRTDVKWIRSALQNQGLRGEDRH